MALACENSYFGLDKKKRIKIKIQAKTGIEFTQSHV